MKKNKPIDIYWTLHPNIATPSAIYRDPEKQTVLAPCPVVSDYNSRIRFLKSPFHLEISPKWIFDAKTDQYIFDGFDARSNDVQDPFLWSPDTINVTGETTWYDPSKAQFQYILPYVFLAEEDVQMYLMGLQSSETTSQLDEIRNIEAVLNIGQIPRGLSSAFAFEKMFETKAVFTKNQPQIKLVFSDRVRLHKFTAPESLKMWLGENTNLTNMNRGTGSLFETIQRRRPKSLFEDIKNNIEYSEA